MRFLNAEQQRALELVKQNKNVFVSGKAGTGKSALVSAIKDEKKNVVICAPTGLAANAVQGMTIHSLFRLPTRPLAYNEPLHNHHASLDYVQTLIIDEISMVRHDVFTYIKRKIEEIETKNGRTVQLVTLGDFFQLPPVVTSRDRVIFNQTWGPNYSQGYYCFLTTAWQKCNFEYVELTQNFRQQMDLEFQDNLNKLRVEDLSCIFYFNTCCAKTIIPAISLCARKEMVNKINTQEIAKLKTEGKIYKAIQQGSFDDSQKRTTSNLELKRNMRVMAIANDPNGSYFNGLLGTVIGLQDASVVVQFDNGRIAERTRYMWECREYQVEGQIISDVVGGTFSQIPLVPGYAITIHKAQGATLNAANIDTDVFANSMLYVALSRVSTCSNVHLMRPIKKEVVTVSSTVKKFYASLSNM